MPITMVNPPSKSKAGASLHALGGSLWTGRVLQTRLLWGRTPGEAAQGAQATAPHPTTAERRRLGRPDFQPSSSSQHLAICGILAPFGLFMVKVHGRTRPLNHVESSTCVKCRRTEGLRAWRWESGLKMETIWVLIPLLPLAYCVTLGKWLSGSKPQSPL